MVLALVLALAGVLASCDTTSTGAPAPLSPPNIVLILADDAGYADFGFQADAQPDIAGLTPNIDSIAKRGVRFTSFYMTAAICSPSRAGLVTGRYQQRFGHEMNMLPDYMDGGMSLEEKTFADRLRDLGYRTACVGKWHLGYPEAYHPNERGFDTFFGFLAAWRSYFPVEDPTPFQVIQEDGEPLEEEGYLTDRFGQAAARFIAENADRPFFLYLAFTAPHAPLEGKPEDLALDRIAGIQTRKRRRHVALIKALDDNVGIVLDALRDAGVDGNTLIVVTNDNGGQPGTGAVNRPLRGGKGTLWEGGIRVPCAMRWDGVIEPGGVIEEPAISLDLLPTFVKAAGGELREDWNLDGVDLGPRIRGEQESLPERALFWRKSGHSGPVAVRSGRWKLVLRHRADGKPALFDLENGPSESENLAASHPDQVERLSAIVDAWEEQMIEPLWHGNQPFGAGWD